MMKLAEINSETQFRDNFDSPDRAATMARLDKLFDAGASGSRGAVLKLYIENFNFFNEMFGYSYGGLLIREIARFLCSFEEADAYRYAGVEFIIVLDGCNYARTMEISQQILDRFERTWKISEMESMCCVSMGIEFCPGIAGDTQELLQDLEHSVAEASSFGQNQLAVYDTGLHEKLGRKAVIAKYIADALEQCEIEVRYLPVYNMEQKRFSRAETELMLPTAEFGLVSAREFTPVAGDAGQICALNLCAVKCVCRAIRRLLDADVVLESVCVQISPVQFLQEKFPEDVARILDEYDIPEKMLAFEVTDSALVSSFGRARHVMSELSDMGVEFVFNEFGQGLSDIGSALSMPVDVLKLEQLFMGQLETNPTSAHVIDGIVTIADKLGLKVIAEGVGTAYQVEQLDRFGCVYRQGLYYSPAVGEAELVRLLSGAVLH